MINYFQNFPKIKYQIGSDNLTTVDMTVRFKIVDMVMNNHNTYYNYYWQDSDRLDIVAHKYYEDTRYAWLVMMSGQIFDWIYDLPLNAAEFDEYLERKYNVSDAYILKKYTHHYEDVFGVVIDESSYNQLEPSFRKDISIYQYESIINENKRNIKLVSKSLLDKITNEFDKKLQQIKNTRKLANYE